MESRVDLTVDRARGVVDPLAAEIGELGGLVKQLAETVAGHEQALRHEGVLATPPAPLAAAEAQVADGTLALSESDAVSGTLKLSGISRDGIGAMIAAAMNSERIDLYLQPIVTLPQRKVRYYEALSRLRTEEGEVIPAGDFIDVAESCGLLPKLDNILMFRCVQVMRRLQMKIATSGCSAISAPPRCRTRSISSSSSISWTPTARSGPR